MKTALFGSYAEYVMGILFILILLAKVNQISDLYIIDLLGMGIILGTIGYMLFTRR
ncbi:hypothetical protein KAR91_25250 [Candidatus Pacearchaeota archaeon]|nr:hypothetical protein [Candidatus Pacearchaeota archaeon]